MIDSAENKKNRDLLKSKIKDLKLSMLLEITKGINNNVSINSLFEIFETILSKPLNIGRALVYYNTNGHWECVIKYGVDDQTLSKIDVTKDVLNFTEMKVIESPINAAGISSFDVVIPVSHKSVPLAYILLGDLNEDALKISPIIKHLPFIQTLANVILVAVENKRLYKENLLKERLKRELELASEMQNMLFPSQLPNNEFLDIYAHYQPHSQVGGDYYDFIKLNEKEVVLCVADVSGKGVSAALLMANFQANLRAMVKYFDSLEQVVYELNKKVLESAKGEKFVTLFIAKYNIETRELTYINAAHYPPILYNNATMSLLETGCTGMGMLDELPNVEVGKIILHPDATLVCYTDGIIDLENKFGEVFNMEWVETVIQDTQFKTSEEMSSEIMLTLEEHRGEMPYVDDIALLTCRFI